MQPGVVARLDVDGLVIPTPQFLAQPFRIDGAASACLEFFDIQLYLARFRRVVTEAVISVEVVKDPALIGKP
jgi:hypothetical protein